MKTEVMPSSIIEILPKENLSEITGEFSDKAGNPFKLKMRRNASGEYFLYFIRTEPLGKTDVAISQTGPHRTAEEVQTEWLKFLINPNSYLNP